MRNMTKSSRPWPPNSPDLNPMYQCIRALLAAGGGPFQAGGFNVVADQCRFPLIVRN